MDVETSASPPREGPIEALRDYSGVFGTLSEPSIHCIISELQQRKLASRQASMP